MVVHETDLEGQKLLDAVAFATGLPENVAEEAIGSLLSQYGQESDSLTMDQLRAVMLQFLEEINNDVMMSEAEESLNNVAATAPIDLFAKSTI